LLQVSHRRERTVPQTKRRYASPFFRHAPGATPVGRLGRTNPAQFAANTKIGLKTQPQRRRDRLVAPLFSRLQIRGDFFGGKNATEFGFQKRNRGAFAELKSRVHRRSAE
jgi:hypothetical protein